MGRKRENQLSLPGLWPDHRLAQESKTVSKILEDNPSLLELVLHNLCDTGSSRQGALDLSPEQVLCSAILKNWHQLSYTKVAFLLGDSQSFRRFASLPFHLSPSASCLQENLSRIQASTWQQINWLLVGRADHQELKRGRKNPADATAVECPILYPTDSRREKGTVPVSSPRPQMVDKTGIMDNVVVPVPRHVYDGLPENVKPLFRHWVEF